VTIGQHYVDPVVQGAGMAICHRRIGQNFDRQERREVIIRRLEAGITKPFENQIGVHVITTRNP